MSENIINTTADYGVRLTTIGRPAAGTTSLVIRIRGEHIGSMSIDSTGTVRIAGDEIEIEHSAF